MPFTTATCPNCGGQFKFESSLETCFCAKCGKKVIVRDLIQKVKDEGGSEPQLTEEIFKKAQTGDVNAQYTLGTALASTGSAEPSREKAFKMMQEATCWLGQAARNGHADAQHTLGYFATMAEEHDKAAWFFSQAAEQGHAKAQFDLGRCYATGQGVEQNIERAAYWWEKAAEQGCASAQNSVNLAMLYFNGVGLEKNAKKAVYWLKKGADLGDAKAQDYLANCYAFGDGIEKDIDKAVYWWGEAAAQGYREAQINLSICYEKGTGVRQDLEKASYWRNNAERR